MAIDLFSTLCLFINASKSKLLSISSVSDKAIILSTSMYFSISSAKLSNFCFKESISTLGIRPRCLDSNEKFLFGGK